MLCHVVRGFNQRPSVEICQECWSCLEKCSMLTWRVKNEDLDNKSQTKWESYSNMFFELCLFKEKLLWTK